MIPRRCRTPVVTPERPGQFRPGIIELRILPCFAVIEADLDARYAAIAAERDAAHRDSTRRDRALKSRFMVRLIDPRSRRHDEVRAPALFLVKPERAFFRDLDARDPLHVFLAKVTGNDHARRKPVAVWQRLSVHLVNDERGGIE